MLSRKLMVLALAAPFFVVAPTINSQVSYAYAQSERAAEAKQLVERLGKEAVDLLKNEGSSDADKRSGFTALVDRDFNMNLIGRFVLGKHWRKASKEQQEEFQGLFKKYIINTYQKRIGEYSGENLKIGKTKEINKKEVLVRSEIIRPKGPPIKLDWRVRKNKKTGEQKIVDIIVENVSMALTHREEFSAVVSQRGGKVEGLLEKLRDHVADKSS